MPGGKHVLGQSRERHIFGTVKVGEKGQIVIPKEARTVFGIQPGDTLLVLGDETRGYPLLTHLRQVVQRLNPDAILLGEVDVAVEDYRHYFGQGDRLQMVLNFWLNKYLYLSLAQQRAAPVVKALQAMVTPPE